jgi:hypothetical protein
MTARQLALLLGFSCVLCGILWVSLLGLPTTPSPESLAPSSDSSGIFTQLTRSLVWQN